MGIQWKVSEFGQLSSKEIYNILRLRSEVFVVEQQCIFLDLDELDFQAIHLTGYNKGQLIAYSRLFNKGIVAALPSIGRVVISPQSRHNGIGKILMGKAIDLIYELYGRQPIFIGAQCYLQKFYNSFGFKTQGEIYFEDGIAHVKMVLS
ncbi:MAG TPA: GNAT family N-acetyltransferase [Chitinophagaceae bacterium]|nr:GNAT family N-acetyltransferase [Chitinophagaceae bacterium]